MGASSEPSLSPLVCHGLLLSLHIGTILGLSMLLVSLLTTDKITGSGFGILVGGSVGLGTMVYVNGWAMGQQRQSVAAGVAKVHSLAAMQ